jgi:archaellum component FlaC
MASPQSTPPPLPGKSAGLGEYLKRAFGYKWNLLLLLGGLAAAVLTPVPDALVPLVLAAEVAYLGGLVAHPRFREAVDAQVYREIKAPQAIAASQSLASVMSTLSAESRHRFEELRNRCLEMRAIARGVRGGQDKAGEDLSTPALDRLLWVFLRLLVSDEALRKFLEETHVDEIRSRLEETTKKLETTKGGDERFVHSLQDNLAAQQLRFDNYGRAKQNAEFVHLELDRIEAKIQVLAEAGVNQHDPNFLTSQIEGVAESMHSTEKAIRDLNEITGMVDQMQEPPAILEADWRRVAQ